MESGVLKQWFDRVDSAQTGNITASQLQSALAVGNLDLPLSIVQQMIRMYDFDRNGTMSFEEFVALNQFLLKIQQTFSDLERNRGFLLHDEVYEALVKLGFSLDSPAFYTACESFDQKKNGMFRLDAFISLCIIVQSARNLFNSFDTTKQGRVTLDLNQFIYCKLKVIKILSLGMSSHLDESDKLQIVEYEISFNGSVLALAGRLVQSRKVLLPLSSNLQQSNVMLVQALIQWNQEYGFL